MRRKSFKKNSRIIYYLLFILFATAIPSFIRWAENQGILYTDNTNTMLVSNAEPLLVDSVTLENASLFEVSKVIDGDTIKVTDGGKELDVRLIGVDTPETVAPRKEVECFGKEASDFTKVNLENKKVYLISDDSQDEVDKYGRLLRYVVLPDGNIFNYDLIKLGYANEYTYKVPYKYQSTFKAAEEYASENNLGLWGEVCK